MDIISLAADTVAVEDYFMPDYVASQLPNGSVLMRDDINDNYQIVLPSSTCPVCSSGAVIVDGSRRFDYEIEGKHMYYLMAS